MRRLFESLRQSIAVVALFAGSHLASSSALAQSLTMSAALELSQSYRVAVWQPVHFEFRNESDRAIDGAAVLPLADASAPAVMTLPVMVPAHSRARATVWGYFARPAAQGKRAVQSPPLSIAEWRGRDGVVLARTPILGVPLSGKSGDQGAAENGEMILLISQRADAPDEDRDLDSLLSRLSESSDVPLTVAAIAPDGLTPEPSGLRPIKAVVLDGIDPESLDIGQRNAMLTYLRGGGVVVCSAPSRTADQHANWMDALLPVRIIGTRETDQIEVTPTSRTLHLRRVMPIVEAVEAVDGDGQAILRGRDYVHVAVKPVGLGRVVFTSFPINALAESEPRGAVLWEELFGLKRGRWEWNRTELGSVRHDVLSSMIGRKVAPWGIAAGLAGGYLLIVVAMQLIFRGLARPKGFVFSVGASLALSGLLLVMGMTRHRETNLLAARLVVSDVSRDGGGWTQESVAYVGADVPDLSIRAADEGAMLRPALADSQNRPLVRQQPYAVESAGAYVDRIERVWEAAGPVDPNLRLQATVRFGPDGATLDIDNGLGQVIQSPLVVCDRRALSFDDAPKGRSTATSMRLNARDDFTSATVLASEQSKRRGQIVKASMTPAYLQESTTPQETPPMLIGWLADQRGEGLIQVGGGRALETKSLTMVRTPLRVEAPPAGTQISVPVAFVRFDSGKLPYDAEKAESMPSQQEGQWLISFAAPALLGQIRPSGVEVEMRVTLPEQTLTIRRGQCPGGIPRMESNGEAVAQWSRGVGAKQLKFDCAAGDYDSSGRVWLLIDVAPIGAATGKMTPWQIKDVSARIDAQAVAPPAAIALDAPPRPSEKEH